MTKLLTTITVCLLCLVSNGQTIDKSPIYNGSQRLTVQELGRGGVLFLYQNPKYTQIVDIVSFSVKSKEDAINLMNECLRILLMPKTGKDNHIRHQAVGVSMVRYGFSQKVVHLHEGLKLTERDCQKIIQALNSYIFTEVIEVVSAFNEGDSVVYRKVGVEFIGVVLSEVSANSLYRIRYTDSMGKPKTETVPMRNLVKKE